MKKKIVALFFAIALSSAILALIFSKAAVVVDFLFEINPHALIISSASLVIFSLFFILARRNIGH